VRPARFRRDPEDAGGAILVGVFRVGALLALCLQLGVLLLERVGDVFEEQQAEHDVLVFSRVHVVAQGIGHAPQVGLEADLAVIVLLG
jgi:hypothetical protein